MTHSHGREFFSAHSDHAMESLLPTRPMEFHGGLYPERQHHNIFPMPQAEGLAGILPPLRIVENYPHTLLPARADQGFRRHHRLAPLSPPLFPFSPLVDLNLNQPQGYATAGGDCANGQICPSPFPNFDQPEPGAAPPLSDQIPPALSTDPLEQSTPTPMPTAPLEQSTPTPMPTAPLEQSAPPPVPTDRTLDSLTVVPVAKVADAQLTMTGAPTITPEKINQVLQEYHSPAAGMGQYIYDQGVKHGINPAMALAFYAVESSCGTKGLAVQNKSWGNVRGHGPHGYRPYDSINESLDQWYNLIDNLYLNKFHADKIGKVVSHYAPNSDGNHESVYVHALASLVRKWAQA